MNISEIRGRNWGLGMENSVKMKDRTRPVKVTNRFSGIVSEMIQIAKEKTYEKAGEGEILRPRPLEQN
jgi:hypothetical protein